MAKFKAVEKVNYPVFWGSKRCTRKFRDECFQNYRKLAEDRALAEGDLESLRLMQKENNDCVVMSFAAATDCSYKEAHAFVQEHLKRQPRRGTFTFKYMDNIKDRCLGNKLIKILGVGGQIAQLFKTRTAYTNGEKQWTVQRFVEAHRAGRYVLTVKGHCMALVDGKLMGNQSDQYLKPSQRIELFFQVQ